MKIRCHKCRKDAAEIDYIVSEAKDLNCTPSDYVVLVEPEYNPHTNIFTCRNCIIQDQWEKKTTQ